jgi:ATP-dependent Clp protease ATP-binding subunit ClpA
MGLAAVLTNNVVGPDAMTAMEGGKDMASHSTIISKPAIYDTATLSSGATRPSAISSSLNILADSAVAEEQESIVGNLLEKAIDDIDRQIAEEDQKIQAQKQKAMEEEARARANAEAEAKQKLEEQRLKEAEEAKLKADQEKARHYLYYEQSHC